MYLNSTNPQNWATLIYSWTKSALIKDNSAPSKQNVPDRVDKIPSCTFSASFKRGQQVQGKGSYKQY